MSDSTQGSAPPEGANGAGADGTNAGEGTPKYLTADDFAKTFNQAFTARTKAEEKKQAEWSSKLVETVNAKVAELLEAKLSTFKPKEEASPPASKAEKGAPPIEENPFVKGLQAQLAELRKANEQTKAEKAAERAKARELGLRSALTSSLTSGGIPGNIAKKAMFELVDGTKRVRYESDDSDNLVFIGDDGEPVDFESGLKSWLKSDDSKIYRPATGAAGSGSRPTGANAGGGGPQKPSREDMAQALAAHVFGGGTTIG